MDEENYIISLFQSYCSIAPAPNTLAYYRDKQSDDVISALRAGKLSKEEAIKQIQQLGNAQRLAQHLYRQSPLKNSSDVVSSPGGPIDPWGSLSASRPRDLAESSSPSSSSSLSSFSSSPFSSSSSPSPFSSASSPFASASSSSSSSSSSCLDASSLRVVPPPDRSSSSFAHPSSSSSSSDSHIPFSPFAPASPSTRQILLDLPSPPSHTTGTSHPPPSSHPALNPFFVSEGARGADPSNPVLPSPSLRSSSSSSFVSSPSPSVFGAPAATVPTGKLRTSSSSIPIPTIKSSAAPVTLVTTEIEEEDHANRRWTHEENKRFSEAYQLFGEDAAIIADYISTRSVTEVQARIDLERQKGGTVALFPLPATSPPFVAPQQPSPVHLFMSSLPKHTTNAPHHPSDPVLSPPPSAPQHQAKTVQHISASPQRKPLQPAPLSLDDLTKPQASSAGSVSKTTPLPKTEQQRTEQNFKELFGATTEHTRQHFKIANECKLDPEIVKEYVWELYRVYVGQTPDPATYNWVVQSILDGSYSLNQAELAIKFSKEARERQKKEKQKRTDMKPKVLEYIKELMRVHKCSLTAEQIKHYTDSILDGKMSLQQVEDEVRLANLSHLPSVPVHKQ